MHDSLIIQQYLKTRDKQPFSRVTFCSFDFYLSDLPFHFLSSHACVECASQSEAYTEGSLFRCCVLYLHTHCHILSNQSLRYNQIIVNLVLRIHTCTYRALTTRHKTRIFMKEKRCLLL